MTHTPHPCTPCTHRLTHLWQSSNGDCEQNHVCAHPTGAKLMLDTCKWRTDGATSRNLSNRVFG